MNNTFIGFSRAALAWLTPRRSRRRNERRGWWEQRHHPDANVSRGYKAKRERNVHAR